MNIYNFNCKKCGKKIEFSVGGTKMGAKEDEVAFNGDPERIKIEWLKRDGIKARSFMDEIDNHARSCDGEVALSKDFIIAC